MFANEEILKIALKQSSEELNCSPEDFMKNENVITEFRLSDKARAYYKEPISCNFVSYGNNIVASVKNEYRQIAEEYIGKFDFYHCFETPNIHWLDDMLESFGQKSCFMAYYFLPDVERVRPIECKYELKIFHQSDFAELYLPEWSNALCSDRKHLDVLGVGAYDGNKLIGLAGCSADCENMWQIGVDVLSEYCQQGIGSSLTSRLAYEALKYGKVPFYCCAWSNIRSAKNAIKCGFLPSWTELTVKPIEEVEKFNK